MVTHKGEVLGHILVQVRVQADETGRFIAVSEPFGVAGFGGTVDEAFKAALSATTLYLETLDAEGARDAVFEEREVEFHREPPEGYPVSVDVQPGAFISPQRLSLLTSSD